MMAVALIASGCASPVEEATPAARFRVPSEVYDPIQAGERPPDGYRQVLRRDQIVPVYAPIFADRTEVDWPTDSLVIGIAGTSVAKAYPVTHLNQHEMVNDELEGTPILVSW